MRFLKPKEKKFRKVDWQVSEQVIDMVKAYSEYTDYNGIIQKFIIRKGES